VSAGSRDRSHLPTEQRLAESMDLDRMSLESALELMNRQDAIAIAAVAAERASVARAIEMVSDSLRRGGRLIYVGAGTSGRLGVLDAVECPPTFSTDPQMVQGIIAGGESAMFRAVEGAEDSPENGAAAVDQKKVGPNDIVLGIAAGGTTPFVHGALRRAAERGAKTIFLCCVPPDSREPTVDLVIRPITGPEVLTGSTRLKAATATKLVLNQITTLTMVRLGKTYENLMVDLRAGNAKLRDRAVRIVATLTKLPAPEAATLLESAKSQVKTAIVMHRKHVDLATAEELLKKSNGILRTALR
jgi:N-acetylmuramic acid 6-phosphate etherase